MEDQNFPRPRERVMIFIDGSNLYHALKESLHYTNIDFDHLVKTLVQADQKLVRVYYYNAPVNDEVPERKKNQQRFFGYLRSVPFFEVKLGRLVRRPMGMVEKGVDVKLAVDMVASAHKDLYDLAILVSGDGDFADAVQTVKDMGKHVAVALTRNAKLFHLKEICDYFIPLDDGKELIPKK